MLRHIVMVRFKKTENYDATISQFKQQLEQLNEKIHVLINIEVGINFNQNPSAFDLSLIADFEDEEGLNTYRKHPEHLKVLEFMKTVVEETAVVDYYI